ncbi:porin family protein [Parabacteroides sp. PF5-6]|uniref:porin family protein n=1 Tax=Parabacteroides sp. PF5-6 TaxID=1742403 RepID=UPI002404EE38|nr:porin family protein [Parabacteroides sp. PF5-6]MDF9829226.1 hypothetical protein [Parabacteroides sp. PF5-6]
MRKRQLYTVLLFLAIFLSGGFSPSAKAQQETNKEWEFKVYAAYNLGGTMPVPLPAEIRKIRSWNPGFGGTMAFHVSRWFTPEWGITTGLGIDLKKMKIKADVLYWPTSLVVGEGDQTGVFTGTFSGKNTTNTRNGYLVLPVMAAWRPVEEWTFRLGGYIALQQDPLFEGSASDGYIRNGGPTGDRINVEQASFDFSDEVRKYDAGLILSADWKFNRKMALTGQFSWGFVPLFPAHFEGVAYKMYNIYFALGIAYFL